MRTTIQSTKTKPSSASSRLDLSTSSVVDALTFFVVFNEIFD